MCAAVRRCCVFQRAILLLALASNDGDAHETRHQASVLACISELRRVNLSTCVTRRWCSYGVRVRSPTEEFQRARSAALPALASRAREATVEACSRSRPPWEREADRTQGSLYALSVLCLPRALAREGRGKKRGAEKRRRQRGEGRRLKRERRGKGARECEALRPLLPLVCVPAVAACGVGWRNGRRSGGSGGGSSESRAALSDRSDEGADGHPDTRREGGERRHCSADAAERVLVRGSDRCAGG